MLADDWLKKYQLSTFGHATAGHTLQSGHSLRTLSWQSGEFDVGAGSYEPCPVPLHIIDRRGRSPDEYKSFGSKLLRGCHVLLDVVVTSREMHCSPNARVTTNIEHWCSLHPMRSGAQLGHFTDRYALSLRGVSDI